MTNKGLTKAEILWTRVCRLNCSYCAMVTGERNTRTLVDWKKGLDNLKSLGCSFAAFYGAEPLEDFRNLPIVINYAEDIGINTTVITSGVTSNLRYKLNVLYQFGARSLSMSYDMRATEKSSVLKSSLAIKNLLYFQSLGSNVRDTAAIITITRKNFQDLPSTIKYLTGLGIYTFFDFVHPDRGQPGSKCRGSAKQFIFRKEDISALDEILNKVLELKKAGYLVHTSKEFLNIISANNYQHILEYNWMCNKSKSFPSWVTIDCDGVVKYCDDFHNPRGVKFDMTKIYEQWTEFVEQAKKTVKQCPGCCWNTHIDSNLIREGKLDIHDYVHGEWIEP